MKNLIVVFCLIPSMLWAADRYIRIYISKDASAADKRVGVRMISKLADERVTRESMSQVRNISDTNKVYYAASLDNDRGFNFTVARANNFMSGKLSDTNSVFVRTGNGTWKEDGYEPVPVREP